MRKLSLLIAAGIVSASAMAQVSQRSVVFTQQESLQRSTISKPMPNDFNPFKAGHTTAGKSTSVGGSRWYDYKDVLTANVPNVGLTGFTIWNDTSAIKGYSDGTYGHNDYVSVGMVFDPFILGFNDETVYAGQIKVSSTDNYIIDSVLMEYVYGRPAGATYTDSLTYAFVSSPSFTYGYFTGESNYGTDTVFVADVYHDSLSNHATNHGAGAAPVLYHQTLTEADTAMSFTSFKQFPVSYSLAAGTIPAISVSFKSGSPTYPVFPPAAGGPIGDTIVKYTATTSTYKYGTFGPVINFSGTGSSISFPPYTRGDYNLGLFKPEGAQDVNADSVYFTNYAFTSATGASYLQYPHFAFHVTCATCKTLAVSNTISNISGVKATPNPATSEATVSFNLGTSAVTTVSLTNMVGQVVATQNMGNVASGKATFNVATLPSGVYFYTVNANGERSTGRVVVAH